MAAMLAMAAWFTCVKASWYAVVMLEIVLLSETKAAVWFEASIPKWWTPLFAPSDILRSEVGSGL